MASSPSAGLPVDHSKRRSRVRERHEHDRRTGRDTVTDAPAPAVTQRPAPDQPVTHSAPAHSPAERHDSSPPPKVRDRRAEIAERQLRNLVSTRSSQVSWPASIRARDYAAPTAEDLARAAEEVVIVQRHYTPAEPLQGKGRGRSDAPLGRSQNKRGN